jgi:hypothetical protein
MKRLFFQLHYEGFNNYLYFLYLVFLIVNDFFMNHTLCRDIAPLELVIWDAAAAIGRAL